MASRVAAEAALSLAEGDALQAQAQLGSLVRQRQVRDTSDAVLQLQDLADHDLACDAELDRLDRLIATLPPEAQIAALLKRAQAAPQTAAFDRARETLRAMTTRPCNPTQALRLATALWWLGDRKRAHQCLRRALSMEVDAEALCRGAAWVCERRHGVLDRFEWVMLHAAESRAELHEQRGRLAELRGALEQDAATVRKRRRQANGQRTSSAQ